MPSPRDMLLAAAQSSYVVREVKETTVVNFMVTDDGKVKTVAPVKVKGAKGVKTAASNTAAPSQAKAKETYAPSARREGDNEGPAGLPTLLLPGTYNARSFMIAWRNAKNRIQQIQALSGYKGYDPKLDISSQEISAKFHVRRETEGIVPSDRRTERSAQRTVEGFVAGMPDNHAKLIQDLTGRERLAVQTMITAQKDAQDQRKTIEERAMAREVIQFESERLRDIRKDLQGLGIDSASEAPEFAPVQAVSHENDL